MTTASTSVSLNIGSSNDEASASGVISIEWAPFADGSYPEKYYGGFTYPLAVYIDRGYVLDSVVASVGEVVSATAISSAAQLPLTLTKQMMEVIAWNGNSTATLQKRPDSTLTSFEWFSNDNAVPNYQLDGASITLLESDGTPRAPERSVGVAVVRYTATAQLWYYKAPPYSEGSIKDDNLAYDADGNVIGRYMIPTKYWYTANLVAFARKRVK